VRGYPSTPPHSGPDLAALLRCAGEPVQARRCGAIDAAYLYATTPHMFAGASAAAFARVRDAAKLDLYGCDCYAYGLLAAGFVDLVRAMCTSAANPSLGGWRRHLQPSALHHVTSWFTWFRNPCCPHASLLMHGPVPAQVVEADMKPYDFLALVPIVQGAGGAITNWRVRFLGPLPTEGRASVGCAVCLVPVTARAALPVRQGEDRGQGDSGGMLDTELLTLNASLAHAPAAGGGH
jgi:hypothetical protein